MELPTSRELELETLLRQRDTQVAELTDEVAHLRQYLSNQPTPSVTDPISLPLPLVSLLLPLINNRDSAATSSSDTVTVALTQRAKVLQQENDELYELLKSGETGRLKEDVRSLRRVVHKLEGALRESHQVISSLSEELEKSQATIAANGRSSNYNDARLHSQSPILRATHQLPPHPNPPANGGGKPPPTAPRAHKKPRLSETQSSSAPGLQPSKGNRSQNNPSRPRGTPDHSPRVIADRKGKPEIEEEDRQQPRTPPERTRDFDREREKERNVDRDRERERPRERERDRHRERDRDRDRDRGRDHERSSKRNGAYGGLSGGGGGAGAGGTAGPGGRRPRRGSNSNSYTSADRTLAERMGL